MVFSSTIFIFVFLPIVLFLYYISKDVYRNGLLLAVSLLFYAYGEPRFVLVMIASICLNFLFALGMEKLPKRKKLMLILAIIFNLSLLFVFKYLGFTMRTFNSVFGQNLNVITLALPIGISFFTFQALSYVIDVYRGTSDVQHSIFDLGLFISLFPQLIAGPIVRYNTIADQIDSRSVNLTLFNEGVKRFICGCCKKIILANNLALVAEYYFTQASADRSVLGAWVGSIAFSLQLFYDFSGYSDMAIGLGKMFGFEFEENFNYPYIAKTVSDFWRRWHISLGTFFRDYVYIPLGGSRVSFNRHIFNMGVVWILTGIWHGAAWTFILWGFMYFVALVFEKYVVKPEKHKRLGSIVYRILVLLYVNFSWVIFNASSVRRGLAYCASMVGGVYQNAFVDASLVYMLKQYGIYLLAGIVFATPILTWLKQKIASPRMNRLVEFTTLIAYAFGFVWSISFLILGAHNPFIYFNF